MNCINLETLTDFLFHTRRVPAYDNTIVQSDRSIIERARYRESNFGSLVAPLKSSPPLQGLTTTRMALSGYRNDTKCDSSCFDRKQNWI